MTLEDGSITGALSFDDADSIRQSVLRDGTTPPPNVLARACLATNIKQIRQRPACKFPFDGLSIEELPHRRRTKSPLLPLPGDAEMAQCRRAPARIQGKFCYGPRPRKAGQAFYAQHPEGVLRSGEQLGTEHGPSEATRGANSGMPGRTITRIPRNPRSTAMSPTRVPASGASSTTQMGVVNSGKPGPGEFRTKGSAP